jgi:WD40 repeat protein
MFKIKPIPKLGIYIRPPIVFEKLARPKGVLVSEIFEHTDTITCLEKVADQFILSGSADGSLRVFDARKIQTNVTMCSEGWVEMKGEGEEKAKIASVASFDQTYAAVVGTNRGQIRVFPIERIQKSHSTGRSDDIVRYNVAGELEKIVTLTNELKNECFCYVTAEGKLGVQDIRLKSRAMGC